MCPGSSAHISESVELWGIRMREVPSHTTSGSDLGARAVGFVTAGRGGAWSSARTASPTQASFP
jgi:hypothetical protein